MVDRRVRIAGIILVAIVGFAVLRPKPTAFGGLSGGTQVGESPGWMIVSGHEKRSGGTFNFVGDQPRILAHLKAEAAQEGLTELSTDAATGRIRLARPGGNHDLDDHIDLYPGMKASLRKVWPRTFTDMTPTADSFVVRYRITRELSFFESLWLRVFNVTV